MGTTKKFIEQHNHRATAQQPLVDLVLIVSLYGYSMCEPLLVSNGA